MSNKSAPSPKTRRGKSTLRRVSDWLHLWLGLVTGLLIFVISITGCIYVFEREIRSYTEPFQFVEPRADAFLPPSRIREIAAHAAFGKNSDSLTQLIQGVAYEGRGRAVMAAYMDKREGYTVFYINPYDGSVLHRKVFKKDFFRIVLMGHYYLWLPPAVGQPIVAGAVVVFVFLLISGMVMWWPKNLKKANLKKSFFINRKASFKRLNYDLHNVLGFYVMLAALVIALTGLVWGAGWFARSVYWVSSGGRQLPVYKRPFSDTTQKPGFLSNEDRLWTSLQQEYYREDDSKGLIQIQFPHKASECITVQYNPDDKVYYRRNFRYFDRHTLKELKSGGPYEGSFERSPVADKISRMNYDIHVGAVLGLPGKILAFFASLVCASLPITGFYIWWGRKKKATRTRPNPAPAGSPQ